MRLLYKLRNLNPSTTDKCAMVFAPHSINCAMLLKKHLRFFIFQLCGAFIAAFTSKNDGWRSKKVYSWTGNLYRIFSSRIWQSLYDVKPNAKSVRCAPYWANDNCCTRWHCNFKGLPQYRGTNRFLIKTSAASLFNDDLSNEPNFGRIHLAAWIVPLKGQCHEILDFWFFSWFSFPQASEYTFTAISNFFKNSRRYSRLKVQMEKIFKQKNFNTFVRAPLGSRVNIYIHFCLQVHFKVSAAWYCSNYLPPASLTQAANLPPVSLTPVAILPPVSTTQGKLVAKFAAGVVDTGGKFAAGVIDTGGNLPPVSLTPVANLPPVSLTPVVHIDLRISPRIFAKNSKRS